MQGNRHYPIVAHNFDSFLSQYSMKAKTIFAVMLFFLCDVVEAQDTLVFKPTKRRPFTDTLMVKILKYIELDELIYIPYDKFVLNKKDTANIAAGRPIRKKGEKGVPLRHLAEVRFEESKRHMVFIDNGAVIRREKQLEYFKARKIATGGMALLAADGFRPKRGIDFSETVPAVPILYSFASYEYLFHKGRMGAKFTPIAVGLNINFIGTAISYRFYPTKQMPVSLFFGFDLMFANSTRSRDILSPESGERPFYKTAAVSLRQNRNELFITPGIIGLSINKNRNFYLSTDMSVGGRIMMSGKSVIYNNERYEYRIPAYFQLRLLVGKKY
jgi:hypothetical protein